LGKKKRPSLTLGKMGGLNGGKFKDSNEECQGNVGGQQNTGERSAPPQWRGNEKCGGGGVSVRTTPSVRGGTLKN